jgi:Glycosyl transferase family 2
MFISGQLIVREQTEFGSRMVAACLESVVVFLDEIIVIDNGCMPTARANIMSMLNRHNKKYVYVECSSADFSTLRNDALGRMDPAADWFFQFDSDDIFWPEKLTKVKDDLYKRNSKACLYGHFYHFMETPFKYQGMYKHRHLYPVSKDMHWELPVHEKLSGVPDKEEDSGLVWTHWGYTRSVISTFIKWVHYAVLEKGNADCYKGPCLFTERGIEHILDDRHTLCGFFGEKYPAAAQRWLIDEFSRSKSLNWQEWVTNELDPQIGEMFKVFQKIAYGEKLGYMPPADWPGVVDYIIKEKIWEKI